MPYALVAPTRTPSFVLPLSLAHRSPRPCRNPAPPLSLSPCPGPASILSPWSLPLVPSPRSMSPVVCLYPTGSFATLWRGPEDLLFCASRTGRPDYVFLACLHLSLGPVLAYGACLYPTWLPATLRAFAPVASPAPTFRVTCPPPLVFFWCSRVPYPRRVHFATAPHLSGSFFPMCTPRWPLLALSPPRPLYGSVSVSGLVVFFPLLPLGWSPCVFALFFLFFFLPSSLHARTTQQH